MLRNEDDVTTDIKFLIIIMPRNCQIFYIYMLENTQQVLVREGHSRCSCERNTTGARLRETKQVLSCDDDVMKAPL